MTTAATGLVLVLLLNLRVLANLTQSQWAANACWFVVALVVDAILLKRRDT